MGVRGGVFLSLKGRERLRGEILTHQRLFGPGQINPEALWTETQRPSQAFNNSFTAATKASRSMGLWKNPSGAGTNRRLLMNFS